LGAFSGFDEVERVSAFRDGLLLLIFVLSGRIDSLPQRFEFSREKIQTPREFAQRAQTTQNSEGHRNALRSQEANELTEPLSAGRRTLSQLRNGDRRIKFRFP
jgi:hypothetical protein